MYQLLYIWDGVLQDMPALTLLISPTYTTTACMGHLHPPLRLGTQYFFLGKYILPGVLPPPLAYILVSIFLTIFWCQIWKYNFSPQTWRSTVTVDIMKGCLMHV